MSQSIPAPETDRELPYCQSRLLARPQALLSFALVATLALGGTLLVYWEALQLPFFFDDMIHLRWLDWHSLFSIWTTAEGLGYYRPLTMSVWKVDHLLFGSNDPARLHLLNLLLHALNSALAGCIAWRAYLGRGRAAYALIVTLLFLTFPFHYQAVPSTSSLSKPLIATLTLSSALLYWEARLRRSRWLLGLSLLAGFLAPFAYEGGVMVPVAILAVETLASSRQEFRRFSKLPALYMILVWGVALPILVLLEPETGASLRLPALLSLWQNGVYFLEGFLFPITPLATPLERILVVDQYLLVSLLSLLALVALLAFYRWVKQLGLLLYAMSWFVVGVFPLWLMLDFSYVITSPRLLYLGAVGSALLWAGIPVLLWYRRPTRWWLRLVAVAGFAGILAFNVVYVRHKMTLASAISAPLWQAVDAGESAGASKPLLFLNAPAWIAPKEPVYRIGTEGFTFIPEYTRVQDFVYVNSGLEPEIRSFMFDPAKQDWAAFIGYAGDGLDWQSLAQEIRAADGVYLTAYSPQVLSFLKAGAWISSGSAPHPDVAVARFNDQTILLDYQITPGGGGLVLDLWWHSLQVPDQDMTVFVHALDQDGQLVSQADGYPLLGLFPPVHWQPGDTVHDIRYIALPARSVSGDYTIVLGWYDTTTGHRAAAYDQAGQRIAEDAVQLLPRP